MNPARLTRRRVPIVGVGAMLLCLMLTLTGCFATKPPTPQTVAVTGTVAAPPSGPPSGQPAATAVDHTLVTGASVAAFGFADGKQVGTTATTDSNGRYTVSKIPKGIDVVVVAVAEAGASSGTGMRLSTLVVDASNGADGSIDGATSLGAEAWGRHYGKGYNVAAWDFQMTLDAARAVLARLGWLDLTPGGAFLGLEYGGGLKENTDLAPVVESVPGVINPLVGPAKEMIQDLRDAGLTIRGTYEQELTEPAETIVTEVGPYLTAVASHVGGLHPCVVMDPIEFPCGVYEEEEDGGIHFVGPYYEDESRWTIHRNDGVSTETWTVEGLLFQQSGLPRRWTARDLMSTTITFKVKNSANTQFDFYGNLELTSDEATPLVITGAVLSANLQDSQNPWLAEETMLTGHYEGEFDLAARSANASVNGSFRSHYVNADGELGIDGSLNAGGEVHFSGSISAAGITVAGSLDLHALRNYTAPGVVLLVSDDVTITGSIAAADMTKPIFDGTIHILFENAATFRFRYDPGAEPPIIPDDWPMGTVDFTGSVNPRNKAGVSARITVSTRERMKFTSSVRYEHGARWIAGTVSFDGANGQAIVDMANQVGLKVNMQVDNIGSEDENLVATGTIKNASDVTIGEIVVDLDGIVRISYIDDTWESLF